MFEFKDFSNEVKLKIFNFLNPKELSRIAIVSKSWEELTKDVSLWKKEKISDKKIEFLDITVEEKGDTDCIKSSTIKFLGTSVKEQLDNAIKNYRTGNIFIYLFSEEELKKIGKVELTVKFNLLLNELKKIIPEEKLRFNNHEEKDKTNDLVRYKIELDEEATKFLIDHYSPSHGIKKSF